MPVVDILEERQHLSKLHTDITLQKKAAAHNFLRLSFCYLLCSVYLW